MVDSRWCGHNLAIGTMAFVQRPFRWQLELRTRGYPRYRFFIVTPTPAPSINRNNVSKFGFFVMEST